MAYDEDLAARVRAILGDRLDVREQKMFGGLTFMVAGHMCCGVLGDTLMIRLDEELANEALAKPDVRPMDFTGRPSKTSGSAGGVGCANSVHAAMRYSWMRPPSRSRRRTLVTAPTVASLGAGCGLTWRAFLRQQAQRMLAVDFFTGWLRLIAPGRPR